MDASDRRVLEHREIAERGVLALEFIRKQVGYVGVRDGDNKSISTFFACRIELDGGYRAIFDWGAEVALTSPRHRSGTDRVAEVARHAKDFAFVVNIQGDEPLVDPRLIDDLVDKLRSDARIDIVTAAHPFQNPA